MKQGERHYRTSTRGWLCAFLILFVPPWFISTVGDFRPIALVQALFFAPDHLRETLTFLCFYLLLFGIPALAIGWVLQAVLTMVVVRIRKRPLKMSDLGLHRE